MNVQFAIDAGLFVQFVATNWQNADGSNHNLDGLPVLSPQGQPVVAGKNYTVAKTIYACDLATDLHPNRPEDEGYKTMAIVAANDADPNDVFVAIRGTLTVWEWIQDAKFFFKPFSNVTGSGLTEDGFTDMYQSFSFQPAPSAGSFIQNLIQMLPAAANVTLTGHSLGGALITLLALDLSAHSRFPITVYTLASPRLGDLTFSRLFDSTVPNCFRVANRLDAVPKVPPPLLFFHVGDEFELVPGPDLKFDLGCEHHLTSYFNMLSKLIGTQAGYPIQPDCLKPATSLPPDPGASAS